MNVVNDDVQAELQRLRAENEALKAKKERKPTIKVSAKGAISVYGLGRFPITLYKDTWLKLLNLADDIRSFITTNDSKLSVKGVGIPAAPVAVEAATTGEEQAA